MKIFVWGMGLMGASLALRLRELGHEVLGSVRSIESQKALGQMGFDKIFIDDAQSQAALTDCDLLVLALNIEHCERILRSLAQVPAVADKLLIFDLCSTKHEICSWVETKYTNLKFVGAHPMAGREVKGPKAADSQLYQGATVFLTPVKGSEHLVGGIETLWRAVGARTQLINAIEHDRLMAAVSHGPHLMACLIAVQSGKASTSELELSAAAGSYRDMTRVAESSGSMWAGIVGSNASNTAAWLREIAAESEKIADQIENGQADIERLFAEAKVARKKIMHT